jgi:hypothetical protein
MGAITKPRGKTKSAAAEEEKLAQDAEPMIENAIILRPTSMSVGAITTNAEAVLEAVKEKASHYQDVSKYEGDSKQAKNDRALLRKQKDATKTTIASIQEAWDKPLEPFLEVASKILKEFDDTIVTIDNWVKDGENKEKEKKRQEIQAYFDTKDFDLVPLDKFFDDRWLNKTFEIWNVKKEIDETIKTVYSNIKTLENIAEHGMVAKAFYLETLDMGAALQKVETLKANAERLAREKADREQREAAAEVAKNAAAERREVREAARDETAQSLVAEALDLPEGTAPAVEKPKIYTSTLQFSGTEPQLLELRAYMTSKGIPYKKMKIFENDRDAAIYMREQNIAGRLYYAIYDKP